jgi:hypothetical protein
MSKNKERKEVTLRFELMAESDTQYEIRVEEVEEKK